MNDCAGGILSVLNLFVCQVPFSLAVVPERLQEARYIGWLSGGVADREKFFEGHGC